MRSLTGHIKNVKCMISLGGTQICVVRRWKKKLDIKDNKYKEICVMMYSMWTLHYRDIPLAETLQSSLHMILGWYQNTGDKKLLELVRLHLQAYVNTGNALNPEVEEIHAALEALGEEQAAFRPDTGFGGRKIQLTRAQVRSMIGRWRPTKENSMSIYEVVDDIISKVSGHQKGRYLYTYHRFAGSDNEIPDTYELIIEEQGSYFYDVGNFRFYTFAESNEKK